MEAEYQALVNTTFKIIWLLWLLNDLGVLIVTPTPLHFDSDRGIKVTQNDVFHEHAKCIEIDCHLFFPCLSRYYETFFYPL